MRNSSTALYAALLALAFFAASGCGQDSKKARSDKEFRVPDSLLTEKSSFGLTVDEYHPIRGGVMANRDIVLNYPAMPIAEYVSVKTFGNALKALRATTSEYGRPAAGKIVIVGAKDLDDYKFLTRKEWWYYGTINGDTLYFEPFDIMLKRWDRYSERSINEIAMIQKMTQMSLLRLSGGNIPPWLREGAASHLAGEKNVLQAQAYEFKDELIGFDPTVDEINGYLEQAVERGPTRISFFISYLMLENLLTFSDTGGVRSFAQKLGEGRTLDEASIEVFGMDYGALLEKITLRENFTYHLDDVQGLKPPDR